MSEVRREYTDVAEALRDYPALADALNDPTLTRHQRKLRALPYLKQVQKEHVVLEKRKSVLTDQIAALDCLRKWIPAEPRLEKNDHSRLHKLRDAMRAGLIIGTDGLLLGDKRALTLTDAHPFVVEHDWAAAFKGAADYSDGVFHLPYEHCAFEFRISGRAVTVIALEPRDPAAMPSNIDGPHVAVAFIQCGEYWYSGGEKDRDDPVTRFAWEQIRAICIALDAEVAIHNVIRAPHALNKKRERNGELPLYDYHVVSLSERHRVRAFGSGTHRSPRLHFRRGHWRHYENHKTWIKWMLVGNPDLGFVEKHYAL